MSKEREELLGIVERVAWRSDDSSFVIAKLQPATSNSDREHDPFHPQREEGHTVLGPPPHGGLLQDVQYLFRGHWEYSDRYQRNQFKFDTAIEKQAATRNGVVSYLQRYAPYIGDAIANSLVDRYGPDRAIDELKANPCEVAALTKGLTETKAIQAAQALVEISTYQETRVQLLDLLTKRGFGEHAIKGCIKKWGIRAAQIVRRDPFKMMLAKIPGAGFLRCDRLWCELGLPPDKLKRQVMAISYTLRSDMSGSTWHSKEHVLTQIRSLVTGNPQPEQALRLAIRAKLLVQQEREGKLWIAETKKAHDEMEVAQSVLDLLGAKFEQDSETDVSDPLSEIEDFDESGDATGSELDALLGTDIDEEVPF